MSRPTILQAAQQLQVCHRRLYAALRRAQIIGSRNIANVAYVREGFFVNEHRGYQVPRTNIIRQYAVSTVTAKGMSLLQEIIDVETRAGRDLRSGHAADSGTARAG